MSILLKRPGTKLHRLDCGFERLRTGISLGQDEHKNVSVSVSPDSAATLALKVIGPLTMGFLLDAIEVDVAGAPSLFNITFNTTSPESRAALYRPAPARPARAYPQGVGCSKIPSMRIHPSTELREEGRKVRKRAPLSVCMR